MYLASLKVKKQNPKKKKSNCLFNVQTCFILTILLMLSNPSTIASVSNKIRF